MTRSPEDPPAFSPLFTCLMVVALLAVWGLVLDIVNTSRGGSIDLRNRVTGIRLAMEERDPYFFKWSRLEDERFADVFNSPASPVSHTTVTPVTLTAFLPLAPLPWRASQWIWLAVQYGCLGIGFYAWARSAPRKHWAMGGFLTCFFLLSPHWRLHADRGQSYVLYAALFLVLASLRADSIPRRSSRHGGAETLSLGRKTLWLEGMLASLLALLRPTYGLLLGLAVARRRKAAALAAVAGLTLWAVLPVLIAGKEIWPNYSKAMAEHARIYLEKEKFPPARFSPSEIIEGVPVTTLGGVARIPFSDTSLYTLLSFRLNPSLLLGTWALLAAVAGILFIRRGETGSPRFWWVLSAWLLIGDYLLPAYRYPYNHILLWPMLLTGLVALPGGRNRTVWISLSTTLLALHAATWFVPKSAISWPGAATLVLAAGVAIVGFLPPAKTQPAS